MWAFLSLYTAPHPREHYRHVYFVHSGLEDESLQVTISKLYQPEMIKLPTIPRVCN